MHSAVRRRLVCLPAVLLGVAFLATAPRAYAQAAAETATPLSVAEQEEFLLKAKIVRTHGVSKGITGTVRATLSDGRVTHDASIQTIDEFKQKFEGTQGTEFNFRDSWRYNVAAYRLDRLLDLGMTPPSVERIFESKKGAYTWWIDDVQMDEGARLKKKINAPDATRWNQQMWHVRIFDQLIYNVDRNLGNLLIDNTWNIWMIDHSRAFRLLNTLKSEGNLSLIDRKVLDRLKALDRPTLVTTMKDYLTPPEIDALLARRDLIVAHFERVSNSVFDWQRPTRPGR
ncbi:MAG TPA: hypothetical protein VEK56_06280 [Vicinamibacterales bacterium]|nr:hypothetical protein [Vicinamibacterales bacterium]